ncbi:MAG: universal stress protein [Thermoleophilia bacterium]|nr:universal stress protein [Thermoleophilia bacterium]
MVKNILVATDGSPRSEKAADAAIMLAQSCNAKLHVLSVVDSGKPRTAMDFDLDVGEEIKEDNPEISDEYEEGRMKPEQQFVSAVSKKASDAGLEANGIVRVGRPAEEILNVAKENSCDMIVVGTHGRGPIATAVMGSIATKVIHAGTTPVLVVPASD